MDYLANIFQISLHELYYVILAIFFASILRGLTGFGFSVAMIIVLTFFISPAKATAFILLWEIMCSIVHLPFVWRHVNWKILTWLTIGMVLGTPIGVWLLLVIPVEPMILIINFTVLCLGFLVLRGYSIKRNLTPLESSGTGIIAGICNGAFANAGLPVILFFFSSPTGIAVGRASIIAFFLITDAWASLLFVQQGITTLNIFIGAICLLPIIIVGMWIGTKIYSKIPSDQFKKYAMILLLCIAFIGIIRTIF